MVGGERRQSGTYTGRERRERTCERLAIAIKLTPCLAVTANDVASTWIRVEAGLIVEW